MDNMTNKTDWSELIALDELLWFAENNIEREDNIDEIN